MFRPYWLIIRPSQWTNSLIFNFLISWFIVKAWWWASRVETCCHSNHNKLVVFDGNFLILLVNSIIWYYNVEKIRPLINTITINKPKNQIYNSESNSSSSSQEILHLLRYTFHPIPAHRQIDWLIDSLNSLSYDRSKASSKAGSPHSAI
jgi:hypothetical protein